MPRRLARFMGKGPTVDLVLGVVGLALAILLVTRDSPANDDPFGRPVTPVAAVRTAPRLRSGRANTCGDHSRQNQWPCSVTLPSAHVLDGTPGAGKKSSTHGDARLFLRDTAAAGRGAGSRNGDTITALWINSPSSVGNTSPAEADTAIPTYSP
jgi:hypothetical protein